VRLIGIVGDDFPQAHTAYFQSRNIDLGGLQTVPGRTFRWCGEYHADFNNRTTLSTELGVFETFNPQLPEDYRTTPYVLLGNIGPDLQGHVLDQMERPKFIVADTMNLWINITNEALHKLLKRVDMLVLNDEEARQLTKEENLIRAGRALLELGPRFVAIKKGEHGCMLFGEGGAFFATGAYPLAEIHDPTGAGDSFVGALAGYVASKNPKGVTFDLLRAAVAHGSVMASFNVEAFSLERLRTLTNVQLAERFNQFKAMTRFEE